MEALCIDTWMDAFVAALQAAFGPRLVFVGLQGSRGRGEAGPESDIDVVVLFDQLDEATLTAYEETAARMPRRDLLCGFVAGADTLRAWDRADCFQFYYDTRPWLGSLDGILPPPTRHDARRAAHVGACGLYHACCHNLLHEKSPALLTGLYKNVRFVLTALVFARTGQYFGRKAALRAQLTPPELALLDAPDGDAAGSFQNRSLELLAWARSAIEEGAA